MANVSDPGRGEIWLVDLNPPGKGHEQHGIRPGLILSVDDFNNGPAELVIVLPITHVHKGIPFHVAIKPPEGGVTMPSFIKCEDMRSISTTRLRKRMGEISDASLELVEDRIKILLGLHS